MASQFSAAELFGRGQFVEAGEAYRGAAAAAASPGVAGGALANAAKCKLELGLFRGCVADADAAIDAAPGSLRAHICKGQALACRGKPAAAANAWKAGLKAADASSDCALIAELADLLDALRPTEGSSNGSNSSDTPTTINDIDVDEVDTNGGKKKKNGNNSAKKKQLELERREQERREKERLEKEKEEEEQRLKEEQERQQEQRRLKQQQEQRKLVEDQQEQQRRLKEDQERQRQKLEEEQEEERQRQQRKQEEEDGAEPTAPVDLTSGEQQDKAEEPPPPPPPAPPPKSPEKKKKKKQPKKEEEAAPKVRRQRAPAPQPETPEPPPTALVVSRPAAVTTPTVEPVEAVAAIVPFVPPTMAVAAGPSLVDAKAEIAHCYHLVNTGKLDEAIGRLGKVVGSRQAPAESVLAARLGRGSALCLRGDLRMGIADLDAAVKQAPNCLEALKRRGQALAALGDRERAMIDLDRSLEQLGGNLDPEIYRQRAIIKQQQRDYKAAASDFQSALSLHPENIAYDEENLELHESSLTPAKKIELAQTYNFLGLCQTQLGSEEAPRSFELAIALNPEFKEAWLNLGQACRERGDAGGSIRALEAALKLDQRFASAHHARGLTLYGCGKHSEARESFLEAAEGYKSPDGAMREQRLNSMQFAALCAHALFNFEVAMAEYDIILLLKPDHACWYQRELCWSSKARRHTKLEVSDAIFDSQFKEGHSRGFAPLPQVAPSRSRPPQAASNLPDAATRLANREKWLEEAKSLEPWIQLECVGFLPNERQHRMFALSALSVAKKARELWNIPASSSWRELYEVAAFWRRESEPMDAVWWIDRLPSRAFQEGFGLQTPIVSGQLKVPRYYSYFERALKVVKKQLAEDSPTPNTSGNAAPVTKLKQQLQKAKKRASKSVSPRDTSGQKKQGQLAEAALSKCATLADLYALCGGADFWVQAPCGSSLGYHEPLEGTRITLQHHAPAGFDLTIRTPGTPERWDRFDAELAAAWATATRVAHKQRRRRRPAASAEEKQKEAEDLASLRKEAIDAALTLFYYWVSFGPLSRGSAACGYAVLAGILLALGFKAPLPKMPKGTQLDWEAILQPTPRRFIDDKNTKWLAAGITDVDKDGDSGHLDDLPSFESTFATLHDVHQALKIEEP